MKTEDDTAQIIRSGRTETPIQSSDLERLKALVDAQIVASENPKPAVHEQEPTSDPASGSEHQGQSVNELEQLRTRRRERHLTRNLGIAAASVAVLGLAGWATLSAIHQPSSWADGVQIAPEKAQQYVTQCITSAAAQDDDGNYQMDSSKSDTLIWNNPETDVPEQLDVATATMQFAEQRGEATGLWFTLGDSLVGACLVENESASAWLQPIDSQAEQPGIYNGFFSTFTLRDDTEGNVYGDSLQFEQTKPEFVRYEATLVDGTKVTGTVQNGYFIVMKRVRYPDFSEDVPVGNADAAVEELTLYRADGTGVKTYEEEDGQRTVDVP